MSLAAACVHTVPLSDGFLIFFVTSMIQSHTLTHQGEPTTRRRFYLECFVVMSLLTTMAPPWTLGQYENLYYSEISQLGLFHALAALAFIHYLKVYIDFRYNRETADLVLLLEMFGISLLASTFVAAWSTMLIV
jgi:hypothetical protein